MPFRRLKIADSEELLRKHYLCCDVRFSAYLEQVAEQIAVENAVSKGWLVRRDTNGTLAYCITEKGKAVVNS